MSTAKPILVVFFSLLSTVGYFLALTFGYEPLAQALVGSFGGVMSTVGGVSMVDSLWQVLYVFVPLIWNAGAILYAIVFYARDEAFVGEVPR